MRGTHDLPPLSPRGAELVWEDCDGVFVDGGDRYSGAGWDGALEGLGTSMKIINEYLEFLRGEGKWWAIATFILFCFVLGFIIGSTKGSRPEQFIFNLF